MKPHKVKIVTTNASTYAFVAVCEYCGKIAFYGNSESLRPKDRDNSLGDCPNSPSYEATLGREIISMVQRIGNSNDSQ